MNKDSARAAATTAWIARCKGISMLALAAVSVSYAEDLSDWKLPEVPVPKDNPQTAAKIDATK